MQKRNTGVNSERSQRFQQAGPELVFLIGTGAGMILSRVFLTFRCIFAVYINCYTGVKQKQEFCLIRSHTRSRGPFLKHRSGVGVEKIRLRIPLLENNLDFFFYQRPPPVYVRKGFGINVD